MPMQRELYQDNWEEIALALKESANWTCQRCGAQRGEQRHNRDGQLVETIITVMHLDHDPWNPDARLEVACSVCHLAYDNADRHRKAIMMQIARGQRPLPGMEAFYPAPALHKPRRRLLLWPLIVAPRIKPTRARARKAVCA